MESADRRAPPLALAVLPLLAMAIPVALTQRPRPSYFFYVGVLAIGAVKSETRRAES